MLAQTCYPASIVLTAQISDKKTPAAYSAMDCIFYRQHARGNRAMFSLLRPLTQGRFKDGAIARILLREFWSKGTAPTFAAFAAAWLQAVEDHPWPNSE